MKNKKKIFVLALLLFAAIGVIGYGVYSYYYTEATFENETASSEDSDNVIRITGSFNPITDASGPSGATATSSFLGNGGELSLECPETTGGHETINCTASLTVRNEGSTEIRVQYYDVSSDASSSEATVSVDSTSLNWGSYDYDNYTYISPGSSATLYASVDVNVGSSSSIDSGDGVYVDSPVSSGSLEAYVSFRLEARQTSY